MRITRLFENNNYVPENTWLIPACFIVFFTSFIILSNTSRCGLSYQQNSGNTSKLLDVPSKQTSIAQNNNNIHRHKSKKNYCHYQTCTCWNL